MGVGGEFKVWQVQLRRREVGVISTAQIGFEEPDFVGNEEECNLRGIRKHIARAKELSGRGMVAVNVMVALQQYREHVKEAVRAGQML